MADEQTTFTPEENATLAPDSPEPAPKPEVAPEPSPEPAAPAKPEAMVPSARLREEADKRREVEQRYQRDMGKLEERLNRLQQVVTKPEDQPKAPDWDTAPLDAGKALAKDMQEVRQILQQRDHTENFRNAYAAQAQQFAAKQPDFGQAYQHFVSSIAGELNDAGWTDPAIIAQEVQRMEAAIASKAMQDGVNPAERIYAVAKRRGFAAPAANTNGATEEKVVETLRKGQNAATSTAGAGGSPSTGMSLAKLLEMDDTDFAKVSDRDWKKIMGG